MNTDRAIAAVISLVTISLICAIVVDGVGAPALQIWFALASLISGALGLIGGVTLMEDWTKGK